MCTAGGDWYVLIVEKPIAHTKMVLRESVIPAKNEISCSPVVKHTCCKSGGVNDLPLSDAIKQHFIFMRIRQ